MNNEIVPGFDEIAPRLDPSWGDIPIRWIAIKTELARVKDIEECLIVKLTGELEGFNASYLGGRMHLIFESGFKHVIFDLSNVTMGDYRENLFMATFRLVRDHGGRMILCSLPTPLSEYLEFIGLSRFLEMKDSVEDAIKSMKDGCM